MTILALAEEVADPHQRPYSLNLGRPAHVGAGFDYVGVAHRAMALAGWVSFRGRDCLGELNVVGMHGLPRT